MLLLLFFAYPVWKLDPEIRVQHSSVITEVMNCYEWIVFTLESFCLWPRLLYQDSVEDPEQKNEDVYFMSYFCFRYIRDKKHC